MRLKVDRSGRVLFPKALRVHYGLHPGVKLEVSAGEDGFTLRPVRSGPSMVNDEGIWVHQGVPHRKPDFSKAVRESRERILI